MATAFEAREAELVERIAALEKKLGSRPGTGAK